MAKNNQDKSLKPINILLIEDNPGDIRLVKEMFAGLKGMDFGVEDARDLRVGLERLTQGGIDIILLDLNLPDSTGIDTFRKLYAQFPEIPIIILTAIYDEDLAVWAVREGAQDYINKNTLENFPRSRSIMYGFKEDRFTFK